MSYEAAARYVAAGAALLDEKGPERWRETLYAARERLDVNSHLGCPLGILYGEFEAGVKALWPQAADPDYYHSEELGQILLAHGFDTAGDIEFLVDENDRVTYSELTSEWLDVIEP